MLVGHGAYLEGTSFTLRPGQYVIFTTVCGVPGAQNIFSNPITINLLKNTNKLLKFSTGELNIKNTPKWLKPGHIFLLEPGHWVPDHLLSTHDKLSKKFDDIAGVWIRPSGKANHVLMPNSKGKNLRLSQIIGDRKGIFIFSVCRVKPGTTQNQANKALANYMSHDVIPPANSNFVTQVREYEKEIRRIRENKRREDINRRLKAYKRVTEPEELRIRRLINYAPPAKRLKTTHIPRRPPSRTIKFKRRIRRAGPSSSVHFP